jgi:hypothetical protein
MLCCLAEEDEVLVESALQGEDTDGEAHGDELVVD